MLRSDYSLHESAVFEQTATEEKMMISPGKTYQIINKKNKLAISPGQWSTGRGRIEQWHVQGPNEDTRNNQSWHMFPMDDEMYLIVNKRSGTAITSGEWATEPHVLDQWDINRGDNLQSQLWHLKDYGNEYYMIVNKRSGLVITPGQWAMEHHRLDQWYPQHDDNLQFQLWKFEVVDEYKAVTELPHIDVPVTGIGDVNRLSGYSQPQPDRTSEVLIGQVAVPFAVQDGGGPPAQQAEYNPYLILKRYGYWDLVYYYEHAGNSEYTHKETTTLGLTTSNSKQVEESTGISVSADAGFEFKGFSASISTTVTHQLKTTYTSSATEKSEKQDEISRTYSNNGKRISEALWYRGDRYVVQRMDGGTLIEWRTRSKDYSVSDGYPKSY